MSNFFDKLNAHLTNTGRTVSQKVKNSSDASKLMSDITTENKTIQANLNAIGKLYYDMCKDDPDEPFREMVEAIIRSEQRIAELQESIKIVRAREPELVPIPESSPAYANQPQVSPSAMVCMGCGNTYPGGTAFCAVCGQKLVPQYQSAAAAASAPAQTAEDVQVKPEESVSESETVIDAEIIEDSAEASEQEQFCPYCGKKITIPGQTFCDHCGHAI